MKDLQGYFRSVDMDAGRHHKRMSKLSTGFPGASRQPLRSRGQSVALANVAHFQRARIRPRTHLLEGIVELFGPGRPPGRRIRGGDADGEKSDDTKKRYTQSRQIFLDPGHNLPLVDVYGSIPL